MIQAPGLSHLKVLTKAWNLTRDKYKELSETTLPVEQHAFMHFQ